MKILYVTEMWTALAGALLHGDPEYKGMPAFFRVLNRLVEDGNEVDMLIYETDPVLYAEPISPKIEWLKKIHYTRCFLPYNYFGIRKPFCEVAKVWKILAATKDMLQAGRYQIVYGHGPFSEAAGIAAAKQGIPFGQRRYGDSYYSYIKQFGMLRAICSRPVNYWSYRRPKEFMVATNDGSSVDLLYQKINRGKTPYPLYFWRNGYDPAPSEGRETSPLVSVDAPFLLYVARFSAWKRQDRAIHLLYELKKRGSTIPLYFAGQQDDPDYYASLRTLAEELAVADQIHFLGVLSLSEISSLSSKALACLSFYDVSNFGNVFIEYFTNGGIVLSLDDGSLNDAIHSGENGFLVHDMEEAAQVVKRLLEQPDYQNQIRSSALKSSREYFVTWDERVSKEVELIENVVAKSQFK